MSPAARRTATRRKPAARRTTAKASGRSTDPQDRSPTHVGVRCPSQDDAHVDHDARSSNSHGKTLDAIEKQIKELPANVRRGSASWLKSARKTPAAEKAVAGGARPARKASTTPQDDRAQDHGAEGRPARKADRRASRPLARPTAPQPHDRAQDHGAEGRRHRPPQDHGAQVRNGRTALHGASCHGTPHDGAPRDHRALSVDGPRLGARFAAPPALSGRRGHCASLDACVGSLPDNLGYLRSRYLS